MGYPASAVIGFANRFRKLAHVLAVPQWRSALLQAGTAASTEHVAILGAMSNCRFVVDIGANRGQFALAARHCMPSAEIVSFEPLPGPAEKFKSVFGNDPKVRLVESAVGPERQNAEIHISGRDDSSSLLPIGETQSTMFPGTEAVGTGTISVVRLCDAVSIDEINSPALLKLDVQGFELQALEGCESLLERFEWIYAECSFVELYTGQAMAGEIIAWLSERGFEISGVHNLTQGSNNCAVQADFVFRKVR